MSIRNVPLKVLSAENLGFVQDDESNPQGIYHDGGGGASQNGFHIQVFADSMTESSGFNFVHNSISYFGHDQRDPTNPLFQQKLGMHGPPNARIFTGTALGALPHLPAEVALGPAFTIWLMDSMTPLPNTRTILGCHPCLDSSKPTDGDLYSTMVAITTVDPSTLSPEQVPPTRRLGSGKLFFKGEVHYGNFACYASSGVDKYLYLIGADDTGLKLARTRLPVEYSSYCDDGGEWQAGDAHDPALNVLADRKQYEYFYPASSSPSGSGSSCWSLNKPHTRDDPSGNILTWSITPMDKRLGPDTGDLFWSDHHQTFLIIFMGKFVDGQFWATYAVDGTIWGRWSEPVVIWDSPVPRKECEERGCGDTAWNYQGHAHPGWYFEDDERDRLLLSYSSCARYVSMGVVRWG